MTLLQIGFIGAFPGFFAIAVLVGLLVAGIVSLVLAAAVSKTISSRNGES